MYDFYSFFVPVFQVRGQLAGDVEVNHLHPHALLIQQACLIIFITTSCEVITAVIIQTPGTAFWLHLFYSLFQELIIHLLLEQIIFWLTPGWAYYPFISELNFHFYWGFIFIPYSAKIPGLKNHALVKSLLRICPLRSPFRGSPLGLVRSLIFLC